MTRLRTLKPNLPVRGKRVLVRIDANVPVKGGKVVDGPHGKIARAAVGLEWLRQHGARIIVATHLGRPDGQRRSTLSTRPVAKRLSELLGGRIVFSRELTGPKVKRLVERLGDGDILVLENIRFDSREQQNAVSLAQSLAQLADLYVNDAFAVSHRSHASVEAITAELPSYAGPLLSHEAAILGKVSSHPKSPFILVMGGLKISTKLPVLKRLLPHASAVLVGGALANVFLKAQGKPIGASAYEPDGVAAAKRLLAQRPDAIRLPSDVTVSRSLRKNARHRTVSVDCIGPRDRVVDIGPETVRAWTAELKGAKTIVWNGPLGYCECPAFCEGSVRIAKAVAARTGSAVTVVGGGDTIPIVERAGVADRFTLLSTGGGAMLEFLAGEDLPGVEALKV